MKIIGKCICSSISTKTANPHKKSYKVMLEYNYVASAYPM